MAVITTGSFPKALWPGVNSWWGQSYNQWKPQYTELFEYQKSNKAFEEDVGHTGFGLAPVKNEGSGVSYDSQTQGFLKRYTNVTYALGFIVTEEQLEDNLYAIVGKNRTRALARSMRSTKETVGANVYNRAFNNSFVGADGLELCSTVHPNAGGAGGTQQNELSTAADLSEVALEQACIDISKWTDDRGIKAAIRPQKIAIPPDLEYDLCRILKSYGQSDVDNNNINAMRVMGKFPKGYCVNQYFTDADAWFIITDAPDGAKYQERIRDSFKQDNDFDTGNAKFKARARYVFGWTDWRGVYGSPGA